MLEVVDLFKEHDTRDELGIGAVLDAFTDQFFPGTTTIMTRVAESLPARKLAQQVLKECAMNRDTFARGSAGISLLCIARIKVGNPKP
jgi:transcriptional regulator of met regulon